MCQKAGKLVAGNTRCESTIRSGKAKLVIISKEASKETAKRYNRLSERYNLRLITAGSKQQLGNSIGKVTRTVIVIIDKSFADMIINHIEANKSSAGVINNGENQSI